MDWSRLIYSSVFPSKKRRQGQSQSGDRDSGRELRTGSCTELKFQPKIDQSQILSMQYEKVYILRLQGGALEAHFGAKGAWSQARGSF